MTAIARPFSSAAERSAPHGAWFVLHVKSRQEKALAADADRLGVATYVPLVTRVSYQGSRKRRVDEPLLPGYVFLFGSREEAFAVDRTGRVVRIISVVNQEQLDRELAQLRLAIEAGAPLTAHPVLTRGLRVIVKAGPFQGLEGVIESRMQRNRLVLQVELLGRAVGMEIDDDLLEPLSAYGVA